MATSHLAKQAHFGGTAHLRPFGAVNFDTLAGALLQVQNDLQACAGPLINGQLPDPAGVTGMVQKVLSGAPNADESCSAAALEAWLGSVSDTYGAIIKSAPDLATSAAAYQQDLPLTDTLLGVSTTSTWPYLAALAAFGLWYVYGRK